MRVTTSGVYGPWVPLRLTWRNNKNAKNRTITKIIRGYDVEGHSVPNSTVTQQVTICEGDLLPVNASEVQFRWMNTADEPGRRDMWALFNVTAYVVNTRTGDTYGIFDSK